MVVTPARSLTEAPTAARLSPEGLSARGWRWSGWHSQERVPAIYEIVGVHLLYLAPASTDGPTGTRLSTENPAWAGDASTAKDT